ncbi:hypothetical protein [Kineosporia sp. NBRC 101731]|uniref:hypothetical protein n=1 Tax=Kineosporia sp. NBRC 101731 TaxID=3032199 RepID=UPI0024A45D05|nr:hypothetical protein [Kineosporia sp. NBRC 101731]GLY32990.1 hypothetical protein Kisp02_63550 [Kineosporia sp. NBRC 101731]
MADSQARATGSEAGSEADSAALWGPPGQDPVDINPATPPTRRSPDAPATTSTIVPNRTADRPAPVLESLDGQGQVAEFDLGDRSVVVAESKQMEDAPDWTTDLDGPDGWVDEGGRAAPASSGRRRLFLTAAAVFALVLAGLTGSALFGDDEPPLPTGETVVLGRHLTAPVALHLPEGATATADDSYVGVQFAGGGWVLVTVPEQVVQPDGSRAAMPADPAAWLQAHPDVYVSGIRQVQVDGRKATQLDYRRSAMAEPQSRYARLPLFCGWRGGSSLDDTSIYRAGRGPSSQECTKITDGARVRATFIPIGGRTVLVEAIWRPYGVWGWRMPASLSDSYDDLLDGLAPRVTTRPST